MAKDFKIAVPDLAEIAKTLLLRPELIGELGEGTTYGLFVRDLAEVVANYCGGEVAALEVAHSSGAITVLVRPNDSLPSPTQNVWVETKASIREKLAGITGDAGESGITQHLQQRINDGDLSAEDVAPRMTQYGLMDPIDFAEEMQERMELLEEHLEEHQGPGM